MSYAGHELVSSLSSEESHSQGVALCLWGAAEFRAGCPSSHRLPGQWLGPRGDGLPEQRANKDSFRSNRQDMAGHARCWLLQSPPLQPHRAAENQELAVLWQEARRQKLLVPPDKPTALQRCGLGTQLLWISEKEKVKRSKERQCWAERDFPTSPGV